MGNHLVGSVEWPMEGAFFSFVKLSVDQTPLLGRVFIAGAG
jgi:hypothetical protein